MKRFKRWLRKFCGVGTVLQVYVNVPDGRGRDARWLDQHYLTECETIAGNKVWICEVSDELRELQDLAAAATSPDMLAGINKGIKTVRKLLAISYLAKKKSESLNFLAAIKGPQ